MGATEHDLHAVRRALLPEHLGYLGVQAPPVLGAEWAGDCNAPEHDVGLGDAEAAAPRRKNQGGNSTAREFADFVG